MKFGIGQAVPRIEDERFLTGKGRYVSNLSVPGMRHGVVLRAAYAHAVIRQIDAKKARAMPGVQAIYTHDDIAHLGPIPCMVALPGEAEGAAQSTPRPILVKNARFVGDALAFIVADSPDQARAARDAIIVDYDERPAAPTITSALQDDAPLIWPEQGSNRLFTWDAGDRQAALAAIDAAPHNVRLRVTQNRIAPSAMEPRAALGLFEDGRYHLHAASQGVADMRAQLAEHVLRVPLDQVRVITRDVGGGFGMKIFLYPEYVLALHAARDLGCPVKWVGDRSDCFQGDTHGRDTISEARMGLDENGKILALSVETWSNLGAYRSIFGPFIQTLAGGRILGGVYHIPRIANRVHGVVTNTPPVDAYRGAGRPESAYLIERLMDKAARQIGLAPDRLRRINLLTPEALPHANGLGLTFDVGDFPALLERACAGADWDGFAARQQAAQARGQRLGRGIGFYVEIAGSSREEFAEIHIDAQGHVTVDVGTQSNGQGHETALTQVLAERLGLPPDNITIIQGDTDRLDQGNGTGGSRSMAWGGGAVLVAAQDMLNRAQALAHKALETSDAAHITYEGGLFRTPDSNRTISLGELASAFPGALDGRSRYAPEKPRPTFPNGCHIAEVEIDPETGSSRVARYSVVDDFGQIINPLLVEGQVQGGIAQGLGQALLEQVIYDEQGQLLTGSFMDYALPRASDMPDSIRFESRPTRSPTNPLGVKGCGEAGTIGALPAIMNAIVDALDGTDIDMPATPEKIWSICQDLTAQKAKNA